MKQDLKQKLKPNTKYDAIIVGAGSAGLMCAVNLKVKHGLIIEKGSKPGRKLLLSGGGRCNITHGGSIKDFTFCYGDNGGKIRTCLYKHSNLSMMDFFHDNGLELICDEKGLVYPASMNAEDVLNLLLRKASENAWTIVTDCEISDLTELLDLSDNIIIACGGITYPASGSDGSLYPALRKIPSLEFIEPRSALAPIRVVDYPYGELSGISVSDVELCIGTGKNSHKQKGDILLTHKNLSGPAVLNISRYAESGEQIRINWLPGSSDPLGDAESRLPKRLYRLIAKRAMTDKGFISTKKLESLLTADTFTIEACEPNGMVTKGGIALSCVDVKTMELKAHPGIYAIGEVLDVDGNTGGYNLQFCWSSACTAAEAVGGKL